MTKSAKVFAKILVVGGIFYAAGMRADIQDNVTLQEGNADNYIVSSGYGYDDYCSINPWASFCQGLTTTVVTPVYTDYGWGGYGGYGGWGGGWGGWGRGWGGRGWGHGGWGRGGWGGRGWGKGGGWGHGGGGRGGSWGHGGGGGRGGNWGHGGGGRRR
jgi:hypothetical protein